MPNKCGVVNCKGNYNKNHKSRVFKLPKDETERQRWINVIPPRKDFVIDPSKFFICEQHWPENTEMVTVPGGHTRPANPPSIFTVPPSCLPSPKPVPRKPKAEDQQLNYFLKKDKINSFQEFHPDKELSKKYENVIISKSDDKCVFIFMSEDFKECTLTIIVYNKPTLCSPLTLSAFKYGTVVPLGKILNPNNGLAYYSQFFEAVNSALNHNQQADCILSKVVASLQSQEWEVYDADKAKKLKFITRQLELLCHKSFSVADYCFALESFPKCDYNQLRDFLVLPSKRKLQSIVSSTNINKVLETTFQKVENDQQKNVFLLVDEVKIRPTVAFSGGVLSGMAKNDPESKATSMLCIMMKCLHSGPSVMISVTPVHRLNALYQHSLVKEAATVVEQSGGIVLGSITDNHKINQQYCKLFSNRVQVSQASHPLDENRVWFLLYDNVHLLKCIRNNWITERCQEISFDKTTVGSFCDVKSLYQAERDNILKSTRLTCSAITPSKLQMQNVQHVLNVFNEKVVAALKLRGANATAQFIQQVLDWWNTVNVSGKGQDGRLRDPCRAVQHKDSNGLQVFFEMFRDMDSGHGTNRVQCLTHDTKKALVQTTEGLIGVCQHLFSVGFEYVLLRELQSDRIEGEFSVYRQSTGANAFMVAGDVFSAYKKRLARFAASFLKSIENESSIKHHTCEGTLCLEDGTIIEKCLKDMSLSGMEENSVAYVAGWLESKCQSELSFQEDEPVLAGEAKSFIDEVSRGGLTVPHVCTYELVRSGLCFVKEYKHRACCRERLINVLNIIDTYYCLELSSASLMRRLANVLLHGIQNLEKDHEKNATLYQTSVKKARLAE